MVAEQGAEWSAEYPQEGQEWLQNSSRMISGWCQNASKNGSIIEARMVAECGQGLGTLSVTYALTHFTHLHLHNHTQQFSEVLFSEPTPPCPTPPTRRAKSQLFSEVLFSEPRFFPLPLLLSFSRARSSSSSSSKQASKQAALAPCALASLTLSLIHI